MHTTYTLWGIVFTNTKGEPLAMVLPTWRHITNGYKYFSLLALLLLVACGQITSPTPSSTPGANPSTGAAATAVVAGMFQKIELFWTTTANNRCVTKLLADWK